MLGELIAIFLQNTPGLLEDMRQAVAAGDARALQLAAHTLKSSSATLGAAVLSDLCQDLEAQASAGNMSNAPAKVAAAVTEFARVSGVLQQY